MKINMKKEFIQKQKEKLEKDKKVLHEELSLFAEKDPKIKGNWKSRFPEFSDSEIGSSRLEVASDEVEEYLSRLPVEHSMELRLQDIDLALKKIRTNKYGKCEKCGKNIALNRLEACPEARFCVKCEPKQ
jgi:RNA polymerase-binding transcription factor DksA